MVLTKAAVWILGTLVAALVALLGIQSVRLFHAQTTVAELHAVAAKEGERQAIAVAGAVLAALEIEHRRQAALEEIIREAETTHQHLQDAAIRLESDRDRLRVELKAFVARSHATGRDPAPPGPGQALVDSPVDLLAELYGRSDEAAGILAWEADDRLARLVTCNQSYQAVRSAEVAPGSAERADRAAALPVSGVAGPGNELVGVADPLRPAPTSAPTQVLPRGVPFPPNTLGEAVAASAAWRGRAAEGSGTPL